VREETSVDHGGPKRARNRKRWIEAKGSLQPTESPLLGETLLLAMRDIGNDVYEFALSQLGGAYSQGQIELCKAGTCSDQY
jgi:hypothetical protein